MTSHALGFVRELSACLRRCWAHRKAHAPVAVEISPPPLYFVTRPTDAAVDSFVSKAERCAKNVCGEAMTCALQRSII
ncbi:hypothetical protein EVAR_50025_1 [Eumeta japonica]|uniref:Uncharacterized protein n=1 Tax=Eumeta variegata TaxID=151549 RepID=A0A4C1YNF9_EUMVA|nr:hypothetical protein EVAR_50025_1 [Eumeta japonica]